MFTDEDEQDEIDEVPSKKAKSDSDGTPQLTVKQEKIVRSEATTTASKASPQSTKSGADDENEADGESTLETTEGGGSEESQGSEKRLLSLEALFLAAKTELQNISNQSTDQPITVETNDGENVDNNNELSIHGSEIDYTESEPIVAFPESNLIVVEASGEGSVVQGQPGALNSYSVARIINVPTGGETEYPATTAELEKTRIDLGYTASNTLAAAANMAETKVLRTTDHAGKVGVTAQRESGVFCVGRKRKHPPKPGRHICPFCSKGCAKPSVLQKHIRAHTGERPYPCLPCKFSFKTKSNLYKHCKSRAHCLKAAHALSGEDPAKSGSYEQASIESDTSDISDLETEADVVSVSDEKESTSKAPRSKVALKEKLEGKSGVAGLSTEISTDTSVERTSDMTTLIQPPVVTGTKVFMTDKQYYDIAYINQEGKLVKAQMPVSQGAQEKLLVVLEKGGTVLTASSVPTSCPGTPKSTPVETQQSASTYSQKFDLPVQPTPAPFPIQTQSATEDKAIASTDAVVIHSLIESGKPVRTISGGINASGISKPSAMSIPSTPKVVSANPKNLTPEMLEERIQWLISSNAAIVDTPIADGPRPKRTSRQNGEATISTTSDVISGSQNPVTTSGSEEIVKVVMVDSETAVTSHFDSRVGRSLSLPVMQTRPVAYSKPALIHAKDYAPQQPSIPDKPVELKVVDVTSRAPLRRQSAVTELPPQPDIGSRSRSANWTDFASTSFEKKKRRDGSDREARQDASSVHFPNSAPQEFKIQIKLPKPGDTDHTEAAAPMEKTSPRLPGIVTPDTGTNVHTDNQEQNIIRDLLLNEQDDQDPQLSSTGHETSTILTGIRNVEGKHFEILNLTETSDESGGVSSEGNTEVVIVVEEDGTKHVLPLLPLKRDVVADVAEEVTVSTSGESSIKNPERFLQIPGQNPLIVEMVDPNRPPKRGRPKGSKNRPKFISRRSSSSRSNVNSPSVLTLSNALQQRSILPAADVNNESGALYTMMPVPVAIAFPEIGATSQASHVATERPALKLHIPPPLGFHSPSVTSPSMFKVATTSSKSDSHPRHQILTNLHASNQPSTPSHQNITPSTPGSASSQTETPSWKLKLKGKLLMKRSMSVERMLSEEREKALNPGKDRNMQDWGRDIHGIFPSTNPVSSTTHKSKISKGLKKSESVDNCDSDRASLLRQIFQEGRGQSRRAGSEPAPESREAAELNKKANELLRIKHAADGTQPKESVASISTQNRTIADLLTQPFSAISQFSTKVPVSTCADDCYVTLPVNESMSLMKPGLSLTAPLLEIPAGKSLVYLPVSPTSLKAWEELHKMGQTAAENKMESSSSLDISNPTVIITTKPTHSDTSEPSTSQESEHTHVSIARSHEVVSTDDAGMEEDHGRKEDTPDEVCAKSCSSKFTRTDSAEVVFIHEGSHIVGVSKMVQQKAVTALMLLGHSYPAMRPAAQVTFCSLLKPQPMYAPLGANKKLSMYSNWRTAPFNPNPMGLSTKSMLGLYHVKTNSNLDPLYKTATISEPKMGLLTHSSYWSFKKKNAVESSRKKKPKVSTASTESTESPATSFSPIPDILTGGTSRVVAEEEKMMAAVKEGGEKTKSDLFPLKDSSRIFQIFPGGYKSYEKYVYIRGRGRGKYVCDVCGIRCKKPSMLKKHIRTHMHLRPYHCRYCNFSFKTKGNLTKHMKSKAHHRRCLELGILPVPTDVSDSNIDPDVLAQQVAVTHDSQITDMDVVEEVVETHQFSDNNEDEDDDDEDDEEEEYEEYPIGAECEYENHDQNDKEKTVDEELPEIKKENTADDDGDTGKSESVRGNEDQPRYVALQRGDSGQPAFVKIGNDGRLPQDSSPTKPESCLSDAKATEGATRASIDKEIAASLLDLSQRTEQRKTIMEGEDKASDAKKAVADTRLDSLVGALISRTQSRSASPEDATATATADDAKESGNRSSSPVQTPTSDVAEAPSSDSSPSENTTLSTESISNASIMPSTETILPMSFRIIPSHLFAAGATRILGCLKAETTATNVGPIIGQLVRQGSSPDTPPIGIVSAADSDLMGLLSRMMVDSLGGRHTAERDNEKEKQTPDIDGESNMETEEDSANDVTSSNVAINPESGDKTDKSGVTDEKRDDGETVGDQKNKDKCEETPVTADTTVAVITLAGNQSIAIPANILSLHGSPAVAPSNIPVGVKLVTTASSNPHAPPLVHYVTGDHKAPFEIMPIPGKVNDNRENYVDGKYMCEVCHKSFHKQHQLTLHKNIHYFERPFKCEDCQLSFRTKGHLEKHQLSNSHTSKLNVKRNVGVVTTDNPRPFKCSNCNIAFRIYGHLTKHLRSKMHITTLEKLGKLPAGSYAQIEKGLFKGQLDDIEAASEIIPPIVDSRRGDGGQQSGVTEPRPASVIHEPSTPTLNDAGDEEDVFVASAETGDVVEQNFLRSKHGEYKKDTQASNDKVTVEIKPDPIDLGEILPRGSQLATGEDLVVTTSEKRIDFYKTTISPTCHRCEICGKTFKFVSSLKQHLVTHAEIRAYICEYCDAGFTNAQALKFHLRTHTQERPYICGQCGDTFARSDHLRQHMKIHNKEPPPPPRTTPLPIQPKPALKSSGQFVTPPVSSSDLLTLTKSIGHLPLGQSKTAKALSGQFVIPAFSSSLVGPGQVTIATPEKTTADVSTPTSDFSGGMTIKTSRGEVKILSHQTTVTPRFAIPSYASSKKDAQATLTSSQFGIPILHSSLLSTVHNRLVTPAPRKQNLVTITPEGAIQVIPHSPVSATVSSPGLYQPVSFPDTQSKATTTQNLAIPRSSLLTTNVTSCGALTMSRSAGKSWEKSTISTQQGDRGKTSLLAGTMLAKTQQSLLKVLPSTGQPSQTVIAQVQNVLRPGVGRSQTEFDSRPVMASSQNPLEVTTRTDLNTSRIHNSHSTPDQACSVTLHQSAANSKDEPVTIYILQTDHGSQMVPGSIVRRVPKEEASTTSVSNTKSILAASNLAACISVKPESKTSTEAETLQVPETVNTSSVLEEVVVESTQPETVKSPPRQDTVDETIETGYPHFEPSESLDERGDGDKIDLKDDRVLFPVKLQAEKANIATVKKRSYSNTDGGCEAEQPPEKVHLLEVVSQPSTAFAVPSTTISSQK